MFILDRINRELQSLNRLELKFKFENFQNFSTESFLMSSFLCLTSSFTHPSV